jgi:alkylated DNA repair protein (DNA oxidative demethylase)
MRSNSAISGELFSDLPQPQQQKLSLAEGAVLLRGFVANEAKTLWNAVIAVNAVAPFRHMTTPGGFRMSVAMTNCGDVGWVSDAKGYRYSPIDPQTGRHWPEMPVSFRRLATGAAIAAGFNDFEPDACLINRYEPGARLTLHQDKDEHDYSQPIVSVSLGLPAVFLWGTNTRKDRPRRIRLESGDVVVWGGPARKVYHGIAPLADGDHPITGPCRINLTFRKAL